MQFMLNDCLWLLVFLTMSSFFLLDEEPVLDWTDWNLLHIFLLAVSLLVVFSELSESAVAGQTNYKDLHCLNAALVYWVSIENYVQLLLVVFFTHSLAPLEVDLLELVDLQVYYSGWLYHSILPGFLLCFCVTALSNVINLSLAYSSSKQLALLTWGVIIILGVSALALCWDLCIAGLSHFQAWTHTEVFYLQPNTTLTYDQSAAGDAFDWHREQSSPFVASLEDLYLFFFQLSLIWVTGVSAFCWLLFLNSHLANNASVVDTTYISYSIADWSLVNLLVCYLTCWGGYFFVLFRFVTNGSSGLVFLMLA